MPEIPLFPLRTVLFPGQELPLRIFEERYKVMVQELLRDDAVFGVLLIREGNEVGGGAVPHDVGTTAHIEQWTALEQGQFALSARGARRFRLLRMAEPRPYPFGEVEYLDDSRPAPNERLTRAVETVKATFPVYFRLALSLRDQWARGLPMPNDPHTLVNFLAPWLRTTEQAKQRLLEIEPAEDRLAHLAEMLDGLLTETREEADEHRRQKFTSLGRMN